MLIKKLAKYLEEKDVGTFKGDDTGGTIYLEKLPDVPNDIVGIFSSPVDFEPHPKFGYNNPKVQIIVRGNTMVEAHDKAETIVNLLHSLSMTEFEDVYIVSVFATDSIPAFIGKDVKGRYEYSLNFEIDFRNKTLERE